MKKESTVQFVLRITLTLLLIATVVGGLLAVVNSVTAPIIAQAKAEKTQRAIAIVLPGGFTQEITEYEDPSGLVSRVYKGEKGYAMEVTPSGFDNTITMMVGVDFAGNILGICIISHTESAGLGAVAASNNSAGQSFRDQFIGMSGTVHVVKDGGSVDAITNATITSRAVCDGVNAALACAAGL